MSSGDSLQPNPGEVIDAAGNVTYTFKGHIGAQGVDLNADTIELFGFTGLQQTDFVVRWLSQADGSVVAQVGGSQPASGYGELRAGAIGPAGKVGQASFGAYTRDAVPGIADLTMGTSAPASLHARAARAGGDGTIRTLYLIDDADQSEVVRFAAGPEAVTKFDHGSATVHFDGSSRFSVGTVNVAHRLGRIPAQVIFTGRAATPGPVVGFLNAAPTAATFPMQGYCIPAIPTGGQDVQIDWIAIG